MKSGTTDKQFLNVIDPKWTESVTKQISISTLSSPWSVFVLCFRMSYELLTQVYLYMWAFITEKVKEKNTMI